MSLFCISPWTAKRKQWAEKLWANTDSLIHLGGHGHQDQGSSEASEATESTNCEKVLALGAPKPRLAPECGHAASLPTIYHRSHLKGYKPVVFFLAHSQCSGTFTTIWFQSILIMPKGTPVSISNHSPFPPCEARKSPIFFFVSVDLPMLDISHKRIHILCGHLWLAPFIEHKCFQDSTTCNGY